MRKSVRKLALVTAVIAALTVATLPAGAQARRTRPQGSAAKPASGRAVSVSGHATRGSAPTPVSGRATYGYYSGGSGYPGYWYPSYGYPGSYWYWGWPYYGYWGYWGWPYRYAYYPPSAGQQRRDAPALVETDLRPKKAEVLLDDEPVGQARDYNGSWDVLAVAPGDHMLEFSYPGHMSLRVYLDARPGGRYRITEALVKGEGIDPRSTELPPEPPVEQARTVSTTVAPAVPPREQGSLSHGLLRVQASPPDAAVYLDGEFLARADELARMHGALPVAEGRHVIEVVRPGYEARRVEIEVGGDEPVKVTVELAPKR